MTQNNENINTNEALSDEELENVTGGMDDCSCRQGIGIGTYENVGSVFKDKGITKIK